MQPMIGTTLQCQRCGAHVPVPGELYVLTVRCTYCGLDQPVPDAAARQRALQQQQQSAAVMGMVNQSVKAGMNMTKWIMIGTAIFVFVIFGIVAASIAASFMNAN
jgi:hypothetical protein